MWYENLKCEEVYGYIPDMSLSRMPYVKKTGRLYKVFCREGAKPYDLSIFPPKLIDLIATPEGITIMRNALRNSPDSRRYLEIGSNTYLIKRPYVYCSEELMNILGMSYEDTGGKIYVEWEDLDMLYYLEKIISRIVFQTSISDNASMPTLLYGKTWEQVHENVPHTDFNALRSRGYLSSVLLHAVCCKYAKKSVKHSGKQEEVMSVADNVNLF